MKGIWLFLMLMAGSSAVLAGDFNRFEFQPYGGFTASGGIPLETEDNGAHESIHVNSSYNVGATFAVNLNKLDAVEAHWQRQFTEGRLPADFVVSQASQGPAQFNLKIDQIHANFLHHYEIADPRALPYIMAGLGATTYYADTNGRKDSRSYFSFALGGGIKYFISSYFGFRGEARWSSTLLSVDDSKFWCSVGGAGANCLVNLKTSLQQQLDLTGGIVLRF
jgi:opacity protein-like surface antigen